MQAKKTRKGATVPETQAVDGLQAYLKSFIPNLANNPLVVGERKGLRWPMIGRTSIATFLHRRIVAVRRNRRISTILEDTMGLMMETSGKLEECSHSLI
jgi:hypothetical protein